MDKQQRAAPREAFRVRNLLDDLRSGLRFYSRLPTGNALHHPPDLDRIARVLPFVSLLLAVIPAGTFIGLTVHGLSPLIAATLAVLVSILVTGAMAEDALADAADGLAGGATPERRLEIMKDSRHGTYGVCALCLLLVMRIVVLGTAPTPNYAAALWIAASILARSLALALPMHLPPARANGASATVGRVKRVAFVLGAGIATLLAAVCALPTTGPLALFMTLIMITALVLGWGALCRRLVGGQTGDLIGALQALIEISALVVLSAFL